MLFFPLISDCKANILFSEPKTRFDQIYCLCKSKNKEKRMKNNKEKASLESFKMETANEVGVTLKNGDNGDLTSRQAGSIGGQMVKKMVEKYENDLKAGK